VSVEVTLELKLSNSLKAGIDLGRERLIAFVTEPVNGSGEGVALLYRGGPLKSDHFYFEKKIAEIDRMLSDPRLEEADRAVIEGDAEALLREEEETQGSGFRQQRGAPS